MRQLLGDEVATGCHHLTIIYILFEELTSRLGLRAKKRARAGPWGKFPVALNREFVIYRIVRSNITFVLYLFC